MAYTTHQHHFQATTSVLNYLLKRGHSHAPLLVFLHGAGEKGQDPEALQHFHIANLIEQYAAQYHLLLPACPAAHASWPADRLHACIQSVAQELGNPPIILAGISMGGRGVYELLYEYADSYTAAICLAAFGIPTLAARFQDTPLWIAHGEHDNVVPVERAHDMAAVLPHAHTQYYQEHGHNIDQVSLSDLTLWQWLQAQLAASAATSQAT